MPRPPLARPKVPNAFKLLVPNRPVVSAVLLHRQPKLRYRLGQAPPLSNHPRLAQLYPRPKGVNGREHAARLKQRVRKERNVLFRHFPHLRSKTVSGGKMQKQLSGKLPKKYRQVHDRVAFYNIVRGDRVRLCTGHEKLLWQGRSKRGREDAEREPRVFRVVRVDKERGEFHLRGLQYEQFPEMVDPRAPNQTEKVSIAVPYSNLELRIPNKVLKDQLKELRKLGIEVSDQLPKHVFATRLETRHVRAPDLRSTKRYRWESYADLYGEEESNSKAGLLRRETRVKRNSRELRRLEMAEKGWKTRTVQVKKRVVVRKPALGQGEVAAEEEEEGDVVAAPVEVAEGRAIESETNKSAAVAEVVKKAEYEWSTVLRTVDASGTLVHSRPKPLPTVYQPRAFTWDRVVLATNPPLNLGSVTRRVKVDETETEVVYEERQERIRIQVPFTQRKRSAPAPKAALDTPSKVVRKVTWSPPSISTLLDSTALELATARGGSHFRPVDAELAETHDEARPIAAAGATSASEASEPAPFEALVLNELRNPYGAARLAKLAAQRRRDEADRLATFVSDTVGAHLVREGRVQAGLEPRVGRKMTVDEVILTARRRFAERKLDHRREERTAYERRFREKWGPSKGELKSARKQRQKARLVDALRKTTLLPGKNQVIPRGLERLPDDASSYAPGP